MASESLCKIFDVNVKQFGENCAAIFNDGKNVKKATYNQIAIESRRVSLCLRELCADGFVGLFVEQDLSFPSLILGILHNNLPFTCIDIQDSQDKVLYLLRYLCVKWVFTESSCIHAKNVLHNNGTKIKTIYLHNNSYSIWHINKNSAPDNKIIPHSPTFHLAYAIQTSGSTGEPKIIYVPHQSIVPNILDIRDLLHIHHSDIIYLASPLTFDPSVVELFVPLSCGAAVLIVPSKVKVSPSVLLEILFPTNHDFYSGTSILQITPFFICLKILQKLLFGGEPCPNISVLNSWKATDNLTEIYNVYGVTEVSCWATIERVDFSQNWNQFGHSEVNKQTTLAVPLGSPLSKTVLQVKNDRGDQIFNGEGELFIGSSERICLINEEVLENLTPPVFRATGDFVKIDNSCNHILFLGRKNRIIKRWGHRVCLGNVEMVLSRHVDVEKCSCVWHQEKNILALAVIWRDKEEIQDLRLYGVNHLHKAEVPDQIVTVKELPLTNHGKIDYEKLLTIILHKNDKITNKDIPNSSHILEAWRSIVGREPMLSEKFMSSGGNSILAIQLTTELERIFGERIRNKLMNMLLNNSSVMEIEMFLLGNEIKSEAGIALDISSRKSSILNNKEKNNSNKDFFSSIEPHEYSLLSAEEILHPSTSSSKRRKLISDSPVDLKHEKIVTHKNHSCNITKESACSQTQHEEFLIKICCRGTTFEKEPHFDTWVPKEGNRLPLHLNWKFDMQKCVDASPCYLKFAKRSCVIVGSHSHQLVVLECPGGELISQCLLPDRIESSVCPSSCGKYGVVGELNISIYYTILPFISCVIGCYNGCVYCISLAKGDIIWSFPTNDMVKSTPMLCLGNTAVVVGSYDSNLYCIAMEDGKQIWNISPSTSSIYASACISSNNCMVYIATLDGTCVSLSEKTGKLQWKTHVSSPVFSSPALVHSSQGVIFTEVIGIVHCFSAINGDKMWQFKADGQVFSSFSVTHDYHDLNELLVFGSHDKNVYCLKWDENASNVSLKWKKELDSAIFATPFIYKVREELNSTSTIINTYVITAASKGFLYVLNAEDGSIKCLSSLPNEIFSSPIVCDGQVLVGCRDNYLYNYSI
ncbi:Acyl-CoA synthetase family member 4 [Gryllus bimaculatus]|nr:Acyl-CoA synthetase family member 4 [Gryllus bimaculatus]